MFVHCQAIANKTSSCTTPKQKSFKFQKIFDILQTAPNCFLLTSNRDDLMKDFRQILNSENFTDISLTDDL